jgi:hypothetical protein
VRVPVFVGHSEVLNIEFEKPISADEARAILREAPGCLVIDKHEPGGYITPMEAAGEDATYISRIREDATVENGLSMWVLARACGIERDVRRRLDECGFAPDTDADPMDVPLSSDARTLWEGFYDWINAARDGSADGRFIAAMAKLEGAAARVALVFRLVRWAAEPEARQRRRMSVEAEDMLDAIDIVTWCVRETTRVYRNLATSAEADDYRALAEFIQGRGGRITASALNQTRRRGCKTVEEAQRMLTALVVHGYGEWQRKESGKGGGRPTEIFVLTMEQAA